MIKYCFNIWKVYIGLSIPMWCTGVSAIPLLECPTLVTAALNSNKQQIRQQDKLIDNFQRNLESCCVKIQILEKQLQDKLSKVTDALKKSPTTKFPKRARPQPKTSVLVKIKSWQASHSRHLTLSSTHVWGHRLWGSRTSLCVTTMAWLIRSWNVCAQKGRSGVSLAVFSSLLLSGSYPRAQLAKLHGWCFFSFADEEVLKSGPFASPEPTYLFALPFSLPPASTHTSLCNSVTSKQVLVVLSPYTNVANRVLSSFHLQEVHTCDGSCGKPSYYILSMHRLLWMASR